MDNLEICERVCSEPTPTSFRRFLPIMASRLCLSLKKSADPRFVDEWSVDHFSRVEVRDVSGMHFAMRPAGGCLRLEPSVPRLRVRLDVYDLRLVRTVQKRSFGRDVVCYSHS